MEEYADSTRIAVVVPCYDEQTIIENVVKDFATALPSARIYVFDNTSTDGKAEIARRARATVVPPALQGKEGQT